MIERNRKKRRLLRPTRQEEKISMKKILFILLLAPMVLNAQIAGFSGDIDFTTASINVCGSSTLYLRNVGVSGEPYSVLLELAAENASTSWVVKAMIPEKNNIVPYNADLTHVEFVKVSSDKYRADGIIIDGQAYSQDFKIDANGNFIALTDPYPSVMPDSFFSKIKALKDESLVWATARFEAERRNLEEEIARLKAVNEQYAAQLKVQADAKAQNDAAASVVTIDPALSYPIPKSDESPVSSLPPASVDAIETPSDSAPRAVPSAYLGAAWPVKLPELSGSVKKATDSEDLVVEAGFAFLAPSSVPPKIDYGSVVLEAKETPTEGLILKLRPEISTKSTYKIIDPLPGKGAADIELAETQDYLSVRPAEELVFFPVNLETPEIGSASKPSLSAPTGLPGSTKTTWVLKSVKPLQAETEEAEVTSVKTIHPTPTLTDYMADLRAPEVLTASDTVPDTVENKNPDKQPAGDKNFQLADADTGDDDIVIPEGTVPEEVLKQLEAKYVKRIGALEEENSKLRAEISLKDAEIARLNADNKDKEAQIAVLTEENGQLKEEIISLKNQIALLQSGNAGSSDTPVIFSRTLVSGFSQGKAETGTWKMFQGVLSQEDATQFFAKYSIPLKQVTEVTKFSFSARATGKNWTGLGLHFFSKDSSDKTGYGLGKSLLVWLTHDPKVYRTDCAMLQLYLSNNAIDMERVLDAAIPETIFDWLKVDIIYDPFNETISLMVNDVEKVRYKTWFGVDAGMEIAFRTLGEGVEFKDFTVQTR
jgi:cell division protein FtsB